MKDKKLEIFLVDDDALFLKALEIDFLEYRNVTIKKYATGEQCLAALSGKPDLIVLDYHLDGIDKTAMNGIEVLDKIRLLRPNLPVIMLSSQDKIDVAVDCMHHLANDYVVKSETAFVRLQKIIVTIFQIEKMKKQLKWYKDHV